MNLLFSNKVSQPFADKIVNISSAIPATEPDWMMFDLYNESGFHPDAENSIGCVGLPQFCPDVPGGDYKTIGGKPYKLQDIKLMDAVSQLDLVLQYFKDVQKKYSRFSTYYDLLLADFYPDAIGKPDNYIFPDNIVNSNTTLFKYGKTLAAYKKGRDERVREIVSTEYWPIFFQKKNIFQLYFKEILLWSFIIALIIVIFVLYKKLFK